MQTESWNNRIIRQVRFFHKKARTYTIVVPLLFLWLLLFSASAQQPSSQASELPSQRFDVVIVSGSSAGVGAALGAARLGVSVALVEDTPTLGGMLANGIGNTDSYSVEAQSGVFREFTDRVREYYRPIMATDPLFGFVPFHPEKAVTWKELVDVIWALQHRRAQSPVAEGEEPIIPVQSDPMVWLKQALGCSTFGAGYAQESFQPDTVVTRGQACALIAAITDPVVSSSIKDNFDPSH